MIKIVAIDPGVTSGIVVAALFEKEYCEYTPTQKQWDVDEMFNFLAMIEPRYIIIEDFEFRQKSRAGLNLFPVQLIGVVRLYELFAKHQVAVVLQKAATGKSYYSDRILKQHGLYKRGIPHGMDASRHLLHWLTYKAGYQYHSGQSGFFHLVDGLA